MSTNYAATIVRINNLTKHPNADKLQITTIYGNVVIVGLDTQINDLGMFFPVESQLSEEFAVKNDLIRRKDENGKPAGGMLDPNRRIRAIKLRGTPSMGLFLPLSCLDAIGGVTKPGGTPLEGFTFEEMNGHPICQKYVPKRNIAGTGKQKEGRKPRESRVVPNQFRFHFDTAQLGRNIHKIQPTDTVVITWKMHGTSAIVSNCLTKRKLLFVERLLNFIINPFGAEIDSYAYDYIYASRRVIKNEFEESKQHYYGTDLWSEIGKEHFEGKLHKGETVYYEIVGYTKGGSPIQGQFDYGCDPIGFQLDVPLAQIKPQHKIYVYRITMTNSDGHVTELQWNQVKERSLELGVETVPEIFYGSISNLFETQAVPSTLQSEEDVKEWQTGLLSWLQMSYVYDQDSQFCVNKVAEEGICVRKEGLSIEVFKLKSFRFLEGETKQLDAGEVDIETSGEIGTETAES